MKLVFSLSATTINVKNTQFMMKSVVSPSTITIKTEPEMVIASVETPKDQVAEADAALEEQAAQDGEVAAEAEQPTSEENSEDKKPNDDLTNSKDS